MSDDKLVVTFECKECGGTVLQLPDDPTDDSIAKCKSCGIEFARWGDIKAKAIADAKKVISNMVKDAIKRR